MSYSPGLLVVVVRQSGTQVARLTRPTASGWKGYLLSASSGKWTKTERDIPQADILGPAGTHANRAQQKAIRRSKS